MRSISNLLLVVVFTVFSSYSLAAKNTCNKVVISGDKDWVPFSYMKDGMLSGVGIELAEELFSELDIPVVVKIAESVADLGYQLRHGEVDVIVGTYDVPELKSVAQLLTPAYFDDVISVVVPDGRQFAFNDWYDLTGKAGMNPDGGQLGNDFKNFADENLFLEGKKDMKFVLKKLKSKYIDYVVGSNQQLKAGISSMHMEKDVKFMQTEIAQESVYLGFAKVSACGQYAPYIKKRIEQLKKNGKLQAMIDKYTYQKKQSKS